MKSRTVISVIVVIIILFLTRIIYSDHTLKKVMGACILAQTQTSSIEEARAVLKVIPFVPISLSEKEIENIIQEYKKKDRYG